MQERLLIFLNDLDNKFTKIFALDTLNDKITTVFLILYACNFWQYVAITYNRIYLNNVSLSCWQFFQNCNYYQDIVFMNFMPELRTVFYPFCLVVITVSVIALLYKKKGLSAGGIFFVFCLTLLPMIITSDGYNRLVYHEEQYLFYGFLIFLFARHSKIKLLVLFYALTYYVASIPKFTSNMWLAGFMQLPFLSVNISPYAMNLLTLLQIVLPFVILFGATRYRYLATAVFELFHFYSMGLFHVKYYFFLITIPFLFLLFVYAFERPNLKMFSKNYFMIFLFILIMFFATVRLMIPGEDQYTREGSAYSLNMFNIQNFLLTYYQDKDMNLVKSEQKYKNFYVMLWDLRKNCVDDRERSLLVYLSDTATTRVVIDEKNYCNLEYKPFSRNEWIRENYKVETHLDTLNPSQLFFYRIRNLTSTFYMFLFIFVGLFAFYKLSEAEVNKDINN